MNIFKTLSKPKTFLLLISIHSFVLLAPFLSFNIFNYNKYLYWCVGILLFFAVIINDGSLIRLSLYDDVEKSQISAKFYLHYIWCSIKFYIFFISYLIIAGLALMLIAKYQIIGIVLILITAIFYWIAIDNFCTIYAINAAINPKISLWHCFLHSFPKISQNIFFKKLNHTAILPNIPSSDNQSQPFVIFKPNIMKVLNINYYSCILYICIYLRMAYLLPVIYNETAQSMNILNLGHDIKALYFLGATIFMFFFIPIMYFLVVKAYAKKDTDNDVDS